jgi:glyoxylate reductase
MNSRNEDDSAEQTQIGEHIFVTRRIPQRGLDLIRDAGVFSKIAQLHDESGVSQAQLRDGVRVADVMISLLTETIDRTLLESSSRLRGIANYAVGYNNIDVKAATDLGIPVSNTPDVLTDTTADLTWALLLAVARRIPQAHQYMAARRYKLWGPNLFLGGDVSPGGSGARKVLGIVGFGRIGAAVARRAIGFDMDVIAYDPHAHPAAMAASGVRHVTLPTLLAQSDFVTLHTPLNAETRHLIDENALSVMKRSAYLINVARGPVVDEHALVRALQQGWIAGAALDVYESEPAMAPGLEALQNVVIVPHIASASHDTRQRMSMMAAENALAHLRGERAPNIVNPEVYETAQWRERRRGFTPFDCHMNTTA